MHCDTLAAVPLLALKPGFADVVWAVIDGKTHRLLFMDSDKFCHRTSFFSQLGAWRIEAVLRGMRNVSVRVTKEASTRQLLTT